MSVAPQMRNRFIGNVMFRLCETEPAVFEVWVYVYGDRVGHFEQIRLRDEHAALPECQRVDRAAVEATIALAYDKEASEFVRKCLQTETDISYKNGKYHVRRTFAGEERAA